MHPRHLPRLLVFAIGLFILAAVVSSEEKTQTETKKDGDDEEGGDDSEDSSTIVDAASQAGPFRTFSMALKEAKLVDTLEGEGPFTVFAPTDDAFARLEDRLDELLANKDQLEAVLKGHIATGRLTSNDLASHDQIEPLEGAPLSISSDDGLEVSGAKIVEPDLTAGNGIIHGIDTVLVPPRKKRTRRTKKT